MVKPKAITVLSGGLDSCVATSVYSDEYDITALTFDYGQKSFEKEVEHAKLICDKLGMKHEVIKLGWLENISNSSLTTDEDVPQPTDDQLDDMDVATQTAKSVWIPARNTVFCSIALAYAESIHAEIIIVGWDYEEAVTFPDNSKQYLEAFNNTIKHGSYDDIEIKAPLIDLDKEGIVKKSVEVDAPVELSYSCYKGEDKHCGVCESCKRRKRAFKQANINDPTEYME